MKSKLDITMSISNNAQTSKNWATTLAMMSKPEACKQFIGLMLKEVKNLRGNGSDGNDGPKCMKWKCTSPSDHYHMAKSERLLIDITVWLGSHLEDRATNVSVSVNQDFKY